MMLYITGAFSYPSLQKVIFRSARRSFLQPIVSARSPSLRYLITDAAEKGSDAWCTRRKTLTSQKLADNSEQATLESTTAETTQDVSLDTAKNQTSISNSEKILSDTSTCSTSSDDSFATTVTTESNNNYSWSRIVVRAIRRGAGSVASTTGFLSSAITSVISDRAQFRRSRPLVDAFLLFLNTSGIDLELSPSLNVHLLRNIIVLGRIQKVLSDRRDRREQAKVKKHKIEIPSKDEALRYMRYATAVYGNNMIFAAEVDARGKLDTRLSPLTITRISEHIGVPEEDIVLVDVDYGGDGNHLRHFVAVDHINRKVVLAIRGTFTFSEIVVDVAAFSRPCFGGEAHSEMLSMAERVWTAAGGTVLKLLQENDGYEFILTGHSLGAGTACLLNIMCHNNRNQMVGGRQVRCFAYASPPVFTPLELVPRAVQSTTNYIHEKDVVPFLSVDSVRHVFSCVRVIEDHLREMGRFARFKLSTGISDLDEGLVEAVQEASGKRLEPKKGAPILAIPAAASVWMREQESSGKYDYKICDPVALSKLSLVIDISMIEDHLPPRYEHAFENLLD